MYPSLPESYDNNFALPCLPTLWSIIIIKNISGFYLFWASDATWKLHLKQAYFHFTCPIIQQLRAAEVTKPTRSSPLYKNNNWGVYACLKRSRFCDKIKDFTLISNARHQNIGGKIVMFVTSFWFSRKIKDYSSYELNYTEVLHSSVYGLYCDKTKLFLISWAEFSRPHGAWLLTSFESHPYMPVMKQRQLTHLKITFTDEKFFLLPIKKLRP